MDIATDTLPKRTWRWSYNVDYDETFTPNEFLTLNGGYETSVQQNSFDLDFWGIALSKDHDDIFQEFNFTTDNAPHLQALETLRTFLGTHFGLRDFIPIKEDWDDWYDGAGWQEDKDYNILNSKFGFNLKEAILKTFLSVRYIYQRDEREISKHTVGNNKETGVKTKNIQIWERYLCYKLND